MVKQAPHVYTIPPDADFLTALARGLPTLWGEAALSRGLILLPTRRACHALQDAFLKSTADPRAMLLPRIQPLGEVEEEELLLRGDAALTQTLLSLPPVLAPMRRRLLLMQLIQAKAGAKPDGEMDAAHAFKLADTLGFFLDSVIIEECDFNNLASLAPDDYAAHWQLALHFLGILKDEWPKLLKAEGCVDGAARRHALLHALAQHWQKQEPDYPVLAAGSTGSQPATAALLDTIARMKKGAVILPGLDLHLEENAWRELEPSHPDYLLARLLQKMELAREDVRVWPDCAKTPSPRAAFLSEAMRPAGSTDRWRFIAEHVKEDAPWQGLTLITASHEHQEGLVAALILRHALETPGKTAALITPDRGLAARVSAMMRRWGVAVDDSAGAALAQTALGHFFSLIPALSAPDAEPSQLMAFLKHPFVSLGYGRAACLEAARKLEKFFFRAQMRGRGMKSWITALHEADEPRMGEGAALLQRLQTLLLPLQDYGTQRPFAQWLERHVHFAEQVTDARETLWRGEAGEALAAWMEEARGAAADYSCSFAEYTALFQQSLRDKTARKRYGQHPRLAILGLLEARLLHVDCLVLAGLNEGTWPQEAREDPWMSPAMRLKFGLPAVDTHVGLMAHDFVQLACQPCVYLLRSERQGEAPTIPSRWLLRVEALLERLGQQDALKPKEPWLAWAKQLDRAEVLAPCTAPAIALRAQDLPRSFSATDMGMWMADPYALYAKKVLRLRALGSLDATWGMAERGNVIHAALDACARAYPESWPQQALEFFMRAVEVGWQRFGCDANTIALMRPRMRRLAERYWQFEQEQREVLASFYTERAGSMPLRVMEGAEGMFEMHARADRIDRLPDGSLSILDYKTGSVPREEEVLLGLKPQLLLEALIAAKGGFAGVPQGEAREVHYARISETEPLVQSKRMALHPDALQETHAAGLRAFLRAFMEAGALFHAAPRPQLLAPMPDYARLARLAEWSKGALAQEDAEG